MTDDEFAALVVRVARWKRRGDISKLYAHANGLREAVKLCLTLGVPEIEFDNLLTLQRLVQGEKEITGADNAKSEVTPLFSNARTHDTGRTDQSADDPKHSDLCGPDRRK